MSFNELDEAAPVHVIRAMDNAIHQHTRGDVRLASFQEIINIVRAPSTKFSPHRLNVHLCRFWDSVISKDKSHR
jgi:hypothetical protein